MKKKDYTVINIMHEWLEKNGFDGLYNDDDCGCFLNDLCPCESAPCSDCKPGYKHNVGHVIKPEKP